MMILTALVRGGAELFAKNHDTLLDLPRVRMRLEGLQVYATLAALLTNACLRLYSSVNFETISEKEDQCNNKLTTKDDDDDDDS